MRNHFHLVLETPDPNLVCGMKWLLGTYTKRFNIRHKLCGHLFAGRYKPLLVEGSGNGYLRTVCDYIHPNPVRAHLLPADAPLQAYRWSSYGGYLKAAAQRPVWLRVDRLLGETGIPQDSEAGRQQFAKLMERPQDARSGGRLPGSAPRLDPRIGSLSPGTAVRSLPRHPPDPLWRATP